MKLLSSLFFSALLLLHSVMTYAQDLETTLKLANEGDATAQNMLGTMYFNGQGVLKNDVESFKWFQRAAQQGDLFSQVSIAHMYANGEGVTVNYSLAYMWASIASARGVNAGTVLRDIVIPFLTLDQFAQGESLAFKCYESNYQDCE